MINRLERLFNAVYGPRSSPLYQTGTVVVFCLAVLLVTGIYLLIFYRLAEPYASVAEINATWFGELMRSMHRLSADLAVVAIVVHGVKMFVTRRSWGPWALAWTSGLLLLGVMLFCGWTGLIMAWDVQGQAVAVEGARLVDLLPILSEPISHSFLHDDAVPQSFFFMNLFLHVALPLGVLALLWLHVSRVARAKLFPPRPLQYSLLAALVTWSVLWPVTLPPRADLSRILAGVETDLLYSFWLPLSRAVEPPVHLLAWLAAAALAFSVPWWSRPRGRSLAPATVDEDRCKGCNQCYEDCPHEAINMVVREVPSSLSETVARVDPSLCVSCGICAGSCAPMGVGPPGRDGRSQLVMADAFILDRLPGPRDVVVVACGRSLPGLDEDGFQLFTVSCAGSVHTSVIELFIRRGVGGVFVLSCPERDCLYREGPRWLAERVYNDREAELRSRVDRRRVRLGAFAAGDAGALRALRAFRQEVLLLEETEAEEEIVLDPECQEAVHV